MANDVPFPHFLRNCRGDSFNGLARNWDVRVVWAPPFARCRRMRQAEEAASWLLLVRSSGRCRRIKHQTSPYPAKKLSKGRESWEGRGGNQENWTAGELPQVLLPLSPGLNCRGRRRPGGPWARWPYIIPSRAQGSGTGMASRSRLDRSKQTWDSPRARALASSAWQVPSAWGKQGVARRVPQLEETVPQGRGEWSGGLHGPTWTEGWWIFQGMPRQVLDLDPQPLSLSTR